MLRIRIGVVWMCLCFALLTVTRLAGAQDNPGILPAVELTDGDTLVFLGDSITHQCLYTQYVEDFFYTRFPQQRIRFHNAGVGGARAWDALARFDDDVAKYQPKYVTVLLGMNDGSYRPYDEQTFQTYMADMTELVSKIEASGATPILMTPTMYDSQQAKNRRNRPENARLLYNSVLAYYGAWLREVAGASGFGFVDMYSPLNNLTLSQRKTDPDFTMIKDSVHPGPNGQLVMACALLEDLGLRKGLSSIRIQRAANGKLVVRGNGGTATDLKVDEDGMSFTWQAEGLPFVVPEEAAVGAGLVKLGHRFSREALEVHTLKSGRYELLIDDKVVGSYTAAQLARHIELQSNPETPQYQQALRVAQLNKQRNEGPVRNLRGQWSQFQRYARAKRAADENPDREQLKKQLASNAEKIAGMEDRVAGFTQEAKQIEDEIFAANKPPARRYVLRRLP